jgi:hypothetical protein
MKTKGPVRKLRLHRETLQTLAEANLKEVAGGLRRPSADNTFCDACTNAYLEPGGG